MSSENKITRREFIKSTAVAGAAVAGSGLFAVPATAAPIPTKWDKEADVVIIGYGGAGASTAITATDAGAKVLILEKAPQGQEGGNTRVSGQGIYLQKETQDAITYLKAMNGQYPVPDAMIKAWAEMMADNMNWVKSLGGPTYWRAGAEFPGLPGAKTAGWFTVTQDTEGKEGLLTGHSGHTYWDFVSGVVAKKGIEIWYGSPVKQLIQNPDTKEILGVVAEQSGNKVNIKAKRAVVMTCGGFENNQEMVRDYLHLPFCYPKGTPYNTGDGIYMAANVGADMWHLCNAAGPDLNFKAPDFPVSFGYTLSLMRKNCIVVAADSQRYINEAGPVNHGKVEYHGTWIANPMPLPVHAIFDETARLAGPIYPPGLKPTKEKVGDGLCWYDVILKYEWSQDNSAEINKGWIVKANSIPELASKIGRDPKVLEATVSRYNGFCAAGVDQDFGRAKASLLPVKTPPFYAMELFPTFTNTQGGPRRNEKAQIMGTNGQPIPRLYSAGEFGAIYSNLYNMMMNVGETIAFGRIAGKNAAAEKPWGAG